MPAVPVRLRVGARELSPHFAAIRAEQGIPEAMPASVEAAAADAAAAPLAPLPGGAPHADRRDIPLLTIDPPGAMDLDQALAIARGATGPVVRYAIADVAAAVPHGGLIDAEARRRGMTVYMPDLRAPLYPPAVGEGACSLLPGQDRRALLWTIALDADGEPRDVAVERAVVRSRRRLTYAEAQAEIDGGAAEETLVLLREVGRRRLAREAERGGVSLSVPVQEVVRDDGGYGLRYGTTLAVEDWNAQVSLLTGICAARIMVEGGVGLFRTLAPAEPADLASLRRSALALGVPWPEGARYGDVVRALDAADPAHAAFAARASRLFGGAAYTPWRRGPDGEAPVHAAIASVYAHVTAPLRRLADRVAGELALAQSTGSPVPGWALAALDDVAGVMADAGRRARAAERAAVDVVEAAVLAGRVGRVFDATAVDVRDDRVTVQIADPAVLAPLQGGAEPGERLRARLLEADPATRRVRFARAGGGG